MTAKKCKDCLSGNCEKHGIEKERMHTIVLNERDEKGKFIFIDVDLIMPTNVFGENFPTILAIIDDQAFHVPSSNILWIHQHYGVAADRKLAQQIMLDEMKKKTQTVHDVSVC